MRHVQNSSQCKTLFFCPFYYCIVTSNMSLAGLRHLYKRLSNAKLFFGGLARVIRGASLQSDVIGFPLGETYCDHFHACDV